MKSNKIKFIAIIMMFCLSNFYILMYNFMFQYTFDV